MRSYSRGIMSASLVFALPLRGSLQDIRTSSEFENPGRTCSDEFVSFGLWRVCFWGSQILLVPMLVTPLDMPSPVAHLSKKMLAIPTRTIAWWNPGGTLVEPARNVQGMPRDDWASLMPRCSRFCQTKDGRDQRKQGWTREKGQDGASDSTDEMRKARFSRSTLFPSEKTLPRVWKPFTRESRSTVRQGLKTYGPCSSKPNMSARPHQKDCANTINEGRLTQKSVPTTPQLSTAISELFLGWHPRRGNTVDGQDPAPPKKPWTGDSPV